MKNDILYIKKLLDAYYQGTTTPGQEKELAAFFQAADDLPVELEPDKELFVSLGEASIPADLEQKLVAITEEPARPRLSPLRRWVRMVAAVAVIGFALGAAVTAVHYEAKPMAPFADDTQYSYAHLTGSDLSPEQVEKQTIAAVELLARTLQMSGLDSNSAQ